ncbi:dynein light chain Tctex-type protein 2B isoform X2 [Adelges cooleyi]|uniref:dynein light chain Tctex-type protein 2B isoform X2 n=1 Tax=Adelges cooleyi TaxID=133065 RepID=UPI00217F5CB6|nr:dynein light chain Tctex-type protein 2B isoform X2 [Adelges cooleyi]
MRSLDSKIIEEAPKEKVVNYQNTFRLESKNPFHETKALEVIQDEIGKHLTEETKYDPQEAASLCVALSQSIRDRINELEFERYKIVCIVEIGEKKGQGVMSITRSLRDFKKDKYVHKNFENYHLFATILVGAFYYE